MDELQNKYGQGGDGNGGATQYGGTTIGGLLQQVQQATTIERGLSTLRTGIAEALSESLGGAVEQQGRTIADGPPSEVKLTEESIGKLHQLYVSLTTEDEAWAEALIANTPMAEPAEQQETQTASRAAMA